MLVVASCTNGKFPNSCLWMVRKDPVFLDVDGLYGEIGASPFDSEQDIRRAAKARLMETHPDTGGDIESFIRAKRAYEVLCDQGKRAEYDRMEDASRSVAVSGPSFLVPKFEIPEEKPGVADAFLKDPMIFLEEHEISDIKRIQYYIISISRRCKHPMDVKVAIERGDRCSVEEGILKLGKESDEESRLSAANIYVLLDIVEKRKNA